jgi:pyruvate/2-oxoglutarate dehydrogenase complex dihydrolipoamide dehydrogenase (E3) component
MTQSHFKRVTVSPMDEYNRELVSYVHPPDWTNPQPTSQYDLVVIGAGTAGLVVAAGAAGLDVGLKIALIDIFFGQAQFTGENRLTVENRTLQFDKVVIATGASAVHPKIKGIEETGYLTNETVFNLTQRPQRLAVIGGGPIGCELAQAFKRLGSKVVLFHKHAHLLNKEDADAAEIVQDAFVEEGVNLVLNAQIERVSPTEGGKTIFYSSNGKRGTVTVDEILIGAGRSPNVAGLNLEAVGVKYDERHGVKIDDYLQTSNSKIFAVGDICMKWKFTHAADAAARIVIQNALFTPFGIGKKKLSDLVMPWVTYTDPEIAHTGMYEHEAQEKGIKINTIKVDFDDLDRAITDGDEEGFLKIHHRQGSDEILGATIVAPHAGEMISEVTTAIVNKVGLGSLASVIHPYPTQAEAIKKAADLYRRTKLTGRTKYLLRLLNKFA